MSHSGGRPMIMLLVELKGIACPFSISLLAHCTS
jgi:hypothetical protein